MLFYSDPDFLIKLSREEPCVPETCAAPNFSRVRKGVSQTPQMRWEQIWMMRGKVLFSLIGQLNRL